jgi:hypothetical protein
MKIAKDNPPLVLGMLGSDSLEGELECRVTELDNETRIDSEAKLIQQRTHRTNLREV